MTKKGKRGPHRGVSLSRFNGKPCGPHHLGNLVSPSILNRVSNHKKGGKRNDVELEKSGALSE